MYCHIRQNISGALCCEYLFETPRKADDVKQFNRGDQIFPNVVNLFIRETLANSLKTSQTVV